jgi:hypothetical protein
MLKPKSSQSSGCIHIHQTNRKLLNKCCRPAKKLTATVFWDRERVLMVEFMQQGITITSEVYCETLKRSAKGRPFRTKGMECWHPVQCSSMTMRVRIQLLALEHYRSIPTASCLITLLTGLVSLLVTSTCLPISRTGCDHSASTIMRSWSKVSKRGWAHRRQTSLTQAYKNLFPNMKSASIPAATKLRSSLSMYVYFLYITIFFSLLVLLTAHQRLLSEYPSYIPCYCIVKHSHCWYCGIFRSLKTCNYDFGCVTTCVIPWRLLQKPAKTCHTNITDSYMASLPRQFKWAQNYDGHISQGSDALK